MKSKTKTPRTTERKPRKSVSITLTPEQSDAVYDLIDASGVPASFSAVARSCFALGVEAKKTAAKIVKGKGKRS